MAQDNHWRIITEDMIEQPTFMVNMGCMDKNFYPAYLGSILSPPVRINSKV
jgi:hypothetical protein